KASPEDRPALVSVADDRSADVRLAWAKLMQERLWPEALESLVKLLSDRRDFGNDYALRAGASWAQFRVARAAANSLGAYDTLPVEVIDALLSAAGDIGNRDPFVACAALSALALKDDARIPPALLAGLSTPGMSGAPRYRPLAQAASWALYNRALVGKLEMNDSKLAEAATNASFEVAGPLLMAFGAVGGPARQALLSNLAAGGLAARVELVLVAAAAENKLPSEGVARIYELLALLSAGERLESLNPADRDALTTWSLSLDPDADVQRHSVWLASKAFSLPVQEGVDDPDAFLLPKRMNVMTIRSFSPAREEYPGPDDGT
ncbi:MAG TPA: hypothetical protein VEQ60_10665, partial [Longimicrobium sp.]|nr:hypothetical protein [Longimicrobium sp.]